MSVSRDKLGAQEKRETDEVAANRIDPDDMGCGQRCFFTYGQMCGRAAQMFNCCLTDYEEAMQKERRWEETVRLKERVLKQRDHLVRLEKEQKQLIDRMTAFQTDTTELIEETGENVRKELKKAFRMEVDISTKELMRKHERLAKEQNSMAETIEDHEEKLGELSTRTDKIKRELNETFIQLQEVDEDLKSHKESTAAKFVQTNDMMNRETEKIANRIGDAETRITENKDHIIEQQDINHEQNQDLARIKKALEVLRKQQEEDTESKHGIKSFFDRLKHAAEDAVDTVEGEADSDYSSTVSFDEDGVRKPPRKKIQGGIAQKMKKFMGQEVDQVSDAEERSTFPEEEPKEKPPYYEYLIHTPSEGETPSEYDYRMEQNEAIVNNKIAEERTEKRKLKKRAKRKKLAETEKMLKKKSNKVAASGGGGASLPAHVTKA